MFWSSIKSDRVFVRSRHGDQSLCILGPSNVLLVALVVAPMKSFGGGTTIGVYFSVTHQQI